MRHARSLSFGAVLIALMLAQDYAEAASVEVTRIMRSGDVIGYQDVILTDREARRGEAESLDQVLGKEVRGSLRQGRGIRLSDLREPTLVHRNQLVEIVFRTGSLTIRGEGRAMREGSEGDRVRVMNLDSRMIVTGRVIGTGLVEMSR